MGLAFMGPAVMDRTGTACFQAAKSVMTARAIRVLDNAQKAVARRFDDEAHSQRYIPACARVSVPIGTRRSSAFGVSPCALAVAQARPSRSRRSLCARAQVADPSGLVLSAQTSGGLLNIMVATPRGGDHDV